MIPNQGAIGEARKKAHERAADNSETRTTSSTIDELRSLAARWRAGRDMLRRRSHGKRFPDVLDRREANTWDVAAEQLTAILDTIPAPVPDDEAMEALAALLDALAVKSDHERINEYDRRRASAILAKMTELGYVSPGTHAAAVADAERATAERIARAVGE